MSDPISTPSASRRPGLFPVIAVILLVLAVLLLLARIVPGPVGLRVTVLETGRVGTSTTDPTDLP